MTAQRVIVVVDDEEGLLMLFSSVIRRLGHTVLAATGGAEAITLLERETPDLIVLDLAMPRVSGFEVLTYMQQTPRLDDTIVLVLTALGGAAALEAPAARADHWVNKPVQPTQLNTIIAELLEGTP